MTGRALRAGSTGIGSQVHRHKGRRKFMGGEPAGPDPKRDRPGVRWLIDGMNVIGSRPDGWWNDPDRAVRRLMEERVRELGAGVTSAGSFRRRMDQVLGGAPTEAE